MPYPEIMIRPMREELTRLGVKELRTPEEVDSMLQNAKGTVMVVVNSICGCAAGRARPGVAAPHARATPHAPPRARSPARDQGPKNSAAASTVRSISSSAWASETNIASNCEGAT